MTEQEAYIKAKKRVKAKKGFYIHSGAYCASVLFLFTVNYLTSPGFWWFLFPALGWGFGVIAHYITIFGISGTSGKDWEKEEMKKELRKIKRKHFVEPMDDDITVPDDELELKEFKKLRNEWDDRDLV